MWSILKSALGFLQMFGRMMDEEEHLRQWGKRPLEQGDYVVHRHAPARMRGPSKEPPDKQSYDEEEQLRQKRKDMMAIVDKGRMRNKEAEKAFESDSIPVSSIACPLSCMMSSCLLFAFHLF